MRTPSGFLQSMRTELILLAFWVALSALFSGCRQGGQDTGAAGRQEVTTNDLLGGWDLVSSSGSSESWYFTNTGRYYQLTRSAVKPGTWRLQGKDIILDENLAQAVRMNNDLLQIGNRNLQRDATVETELGERLQIALIGKWEGPEGSTYEFLENNYFLATYSDDAGMTLDGTYRVKGHLLVLNEDQFTADPIAIDGNILEWGTDVFRRSGSPLMEPARTVSAPTVPTLGEAVTRHSFTASLGDFGTVTFSPYVESRAADSQVRFYLLDNGRAVYQFPDFPVGRSQDFEQIRAVAARDVNQDGRNDILVMTEFSEVDASGIRPVNLNLIYLNEGARFRYDPSRSDRVNAARDLNSINDIVTFLSSGKTSTGSGKTVATGDTKPSSRPDYSKYRNDKSVCRIRVAALQGPVDYEKLGKLSDLGMLSYEPADNGFTRIYLGKYLGKYSAYTILDRVKQRGYPSAFVIVEQDFLNKEATENQAYYTYQISSAAKLNLREFAQLDDPYRSDLYITYGSGRYKLSLGLFQKDLYPYLEEEFSNMAARLGYSGGFSRELN